MYLITDARQRFLLGDTGAKRLKLVYTYKTNHVEVSSMSNSGGGLGRTFPLGILKLQKNA